MIFGLLKLFFVIILVILLLGIAVVFGFLRSIVKIRRQFMNMGGRQYGTADGNGTSPDKGTDKETVIDRRPESEAKRKIFPKSEGEYVNFK